MSLHSTTENEILVFTTENTEFTEGLLCARCSRAKSRTLFSVLSARSVVKFSPILTPLTDDDLFAAQRRIIAPHEVSVGVAFAAHLDYL